MSALACVPLLAGNRPRRTRPGGIVARHRHAGQGLWQDYGQRTWPLLLGVGLPLVLLVAGLRWRRLAGLPARRRLVTCLLEAALALTALAVALMTLTPRHADQARALHLVPFRWIWYHGNGLPVRVSEAAANLLLLVPLGVLLAGRWPRLGGRRILVRLSLAVPLTLECLQFAAGIGRVSALEDVLLGAVGLAAGLVLGEHARWTAENHLLPAHRAPKPGGAAGGAHVPREPTARERTGAGAPRPGPGSRARGRHRRPGPPDVPPEAPGEAVSDAPSRRVVPPAREGARARSLSPP